MGRLLPHEGESKEPFFGDGMGVLIPFKLNQTKPSPTPSESTVDPNADPMQGAADQYEQGMRELAMAARKKAQSAPK